MGRHSQAGPATQQFAVPKLPVPQLTVPQLAVHPGRSPWRVALLAALALATLATLTGLFLLWPSSSPATHVTEQFTQTYALNQPQVTGTVTAVDGHLCESKATGTAFAEPPPRPAFEAKTGCARSLVSITSGPNAGKLTQLVYWGQAGDPHLAPGDQILLSESADAHYAFSDFQRQNTLWLWAAGAALILLVLGGWQGLRALGGLAYSFALIFLFLLPSLIEGHSPLAVALVTGAAVIIPLIPLVHGIKWKSAAALGGMLLALGVASALAWLAIHSTRLSGMSNEENLKLSLYFPAVSIVGVLLCGFVVGALGGLSDVAVAQASTVNELAASAPDTPRWRLFTAAMRVGRDHVASMVYTIVLSYLGAVLPLLILITAATRPLGQVLTSDLIATELMRSGVGALSLILAVPLTTVIAAWTVPRSTSSGS